MARGMKYAGRYDSGDGFLEFASPASESLARARQSVEDINWAESVDIVSIDGKHETVWASRQKGGTWSGMFETCLYCNSEHVKDNNACECPFCGAV